MSKKIYFDLDGTLYGLYKIPNWREMLDDEKAGVFVSGNWQFSEQRQKEFSFCIYELLKNGYDFGVISWLPMQASPEYEEICRREKLQWINENLPFVSENNLIPYGIPKQKAIQKRASEMWLIDDNVEIINEWETAVQRRGLLINNDFDVVSALSFLIEN